jgi:hypothetical protein
LNLTAADYVLGRSMVESIYNEASWR